MNPFNFSLRTQLVLLVGAAFIAGQTLSVILFTDERSLAVQAALGAEAASRAANVARLIESAPRELHDQIVQAASSPLVRFEINPNATVSDGEHHSDARVSGRIRALMGDSFSRAIRVEVHEIEGTVLPVPNLTPDMAELHANMMQGTLAAVELEISIALSGGDWLNVGTRFERPPWQVSSASLLSLLLSAGFGAVAVFWYVIARLTRPLVALTNATDALGRGEQLEPLVPAGPPEVKALATSFNTMQDRLKRFISDRTMMLAALAHDLRSPLTAMRVQSEMVEDEETRASVSRSLDEMSDMVEATLSYARGVGTDESVQSVLLADLFERACADVNLQSCGMTISVRPTSMTRALRNVVENAQRYGGGASVTWLAKDENLELFVDDSGPGIPEEKILDVFEPYVRLEQSRSRGTGGTGLGLSIARSVILAHGGQLELQNRPEGGLRAWIVLPNVIRSKTVPELDFDTK
ncbi:ATP-binding protein [Cognatishimia activa]|uniref:ATP-binding protein n=1 Tax=Cognatishimia activa TaxID=1715691 RepID=UPI0022325BE9|nr:ATP-binding protein [Cognatishimia activa]UZD90835.1 ATP-binding protein [Cognatishimia activa]